MYRITITARAERDIKKLERSIKNRVVAAIMTLETNPRPPGCAKIQSEEGVWRIRIGDWRVGYLVDDSAKEVTIIRVCHRREFYD
ncbi:MAG TPA: type II toxin-antitoxin system RelE/ParE family toxin [Blastocatellia bacterium]